MSSEPQVTWDPTGGHSMAFSQVASARQPERVTAWIAITLVLAST